MSEWKECKLGDVIQLIGGGTPKTSVPEYWDGDIPWLSVVDFNTDKKFVAQTEKHITETGLKNSSTKMLNPGDIIISARGTVGAMAVLTKPMAFNQSCYGVRSIEKHADQNYSYYLLKDTVAHFLQIAHGGVFSTITRDTFSAIDILLPPLPEQRVIASVLSSLDDKIDLLHRQNKTLEAMAETLFRQWFVEPCKDGLPEGWKEVKIEDIVTVKSGTTPSTKKPEFWDGSINWTSPKDITNLNGLFLFETERKITDLGLKQISSGLLPEGSLLMSSRAPVGALAFAEIPVAINQGYAGIVCDKGISREFVYMWLKINMDYVQSHANGSTFQEISKGTFKALEVQISDKAYFNEFQILVAPVFKKMRNNATQIHSISNIRDTLLPKLMSGEVRVSL